MYYHCENQTIPNGFVLLNSIMKGYYESFDESALTMYNIFQKSLNNRTIFYFYTSFCEQYIMQLLETVSHSLKLQTGHFIEKIVNKFLLYPSIIIMNITTR